MTPKQSPEEAAREWLQIHGIGAGPEGYHLNTLAALIRERERVALERRDNSICQLLQDSMSVQAGERNDVIRELIAAIRALQYEY